MILGDFQFRVIPSQSPLMSNEDKPVSEFVASEVDTAVEPADNLGLLAPTKISLVSSQPILAASSDFILVNEFTKRRNQLICIDCNLNKNAIRSYIPAPLIDALWCYTLRQFLLLTENNVFSFDPNTLMINLVPDIVPTENKMFKSFTLFATNEVLIAYNEWGPTCAEKWQYMIDDNNQPVWQVIEHPEFNLTINEFIADMKIAIGDPSHLAMTIFNELTEEWRLEIRDPQTMQCLKQIRLPGRNSFHDFRVAPIYNLQSGIDWLVFTPASKDITVVYSNWTKTRVTYKHPVQHIIQFRDQNLIVRTTERVDIHLIE